MSEIEMFKLFKYKVDFIQSNRGLVLWFRISTGIIEVEVLQAKRLKL